jgi:hypothetical protein
LRKGAGQAEGPSVRAHTTPVAQFKGVARRSCHASREGLDPYYNLFAIGVSIQVTSGQNRRSGFELRRTRVLPKLSSNQRQMHGAGVFGSTGLLFVIDANEGTRWVPSIHPTSEDRFARY